MTKNAADAEVLHQWSARKVQPVVLLYLVVLFAIMILIAHFVVHSTTAVKALAMTAVGAIVPLVPTILSRIEYRLTGAELEQRPVKPNQPQPFKTTFRVDDLSHVVATKHGFKFYKTLEEPRPLRRFFKKHLSDAYSGEVHVEADDRATVFGFLNQCGVSESPGPR